MKWFISDYVAHWRLDEDMFAIFSFIQQTCFLENIKYKCQIELYHGISHLISASQRTIPCTEGRRTKARWRSSSHFLAILYRLKNKFVITKILIMKRYLFWNLWVYIQLLATLTHRIINAVIFSLKIVLSIHSWLSVRNLLLQKWTCIFVDPNELRIDAR